MTPTHELLDDNSQIESLLFGCPRVMFPGHFQATLPNVFQNIHISSVVSSLNFANHGLEGAQSHLIHQRSGLARLS
jgi:hypothetical protein